MCKLKETHKNVQADIFTVSMGNCVSRLNYKTLSVLHGCLDEYAV